MSYLRDATTGKIIREATEAEEHASDMAGGESWRVPYGDHRGVFALPCGRLAYVPIPRLEDDSPIGGPGGD